MIYGVYHYSSWINHIEEFDCRILGSAKYFPLFLLCKIPDIIIKFLMLQPCSEQLQCKDDFNPLMPS